MRVYRRVLGAPRVRSLVLAGFLTRMPIGMGAVGLILFVHGETGSFGSAGAVTGAFAIGLGATGPMLARLIDRRGTRAVVIPGALLSGAGLVLEVVLGKAGAGTVPLVAAAALAGAGTPPVGGVLRQHWPQLVEPEELQTAFAFDAVTMELIFVCGPLLAGLLAATAGPAAGLLVAAALGVAGAISFDRLLVLPPGSDPDAERHWLGAMRSPILAVLVLGGLPLGAAFGARPTVLGPPARAVAKLGAIMALTCLPLVFATALPEMFVFAALAGLCIAPQITVRNNLAIERLTTGTATEAFTWLALASTVGASAGAAVVGPLVEAHGARAGAIVVALSPALATAILFLRRDLLS